MNKYLGQLINLSKLDKEIDAFGPKVESIESTLRAAVAKEDDVKTNIASLEDEIKECKVKRNKNELHLAELGDKLAELSKKGSIVKTDKEIKALQLEEEIAKEQCEFANEEIARLDKIVDAKEIEIAEKNETLEEIATETAQIRTSIESQIQEIEVQRTEVYDAKQTLVADMSQKILTFYEKIRKWAHNTTVVPVKKQACYGCFMRINDKTYAEVIKHEDIVTCPHCGRILYKEIEEVEA